MTSQQASGGVFHDHFSGVAAKYADYRPHYPAELFAWLASQVPEAGRAAAWDCATGNGQAAEGLARHFAWVTATDASAEQIASAAPRERVAYKVAPAEDSGLAAESVALVTVAQALHWFPLDRFYREADRVLRPGGVLAVWTYGTNAVEGDAVNEAVQAFYGGTLDADWPPQRRLVESGYRTLTFPFQEMEAPVFAMRTEWTLDQLLGYFSTWSAVSRYINRTGQNPLPALRETLLPLWGEAEAPRTVTWPLAMRVSRK